MIATLDNFGIEQPDNIPAPECVRALEVVPAIKNPQPEHSVPLEAARQTYRNFPLVRQMIAEAFAKSERTVLLLTSNGSDEKPATEYYLKRVIR